jgi:Uncharacterised protein family (UPF0236)
MGPARTVGEGFFPLDEELGLAASRLTPRYHEHLVHLATWMPFAHAARMLDVLFGVQVSEPTVRRLTEQAGALYEARQTAQSQQAAESSSYMGGCAKQVISADGAYVPLIKGQWAEVRTVAIGEVKEEATVQGQRQMHTCQLSYFSRMTDAETFADLAEVEMRRRGVSQSQAVCAVADGADWIHGFVDFHRPDAVRILDFPHAAEHVSALVEALQQEGVSLPSNVLERSLHVLKHRGPGLLLRWCDRLPDPLTQKDAVQKQLQYFRKRVPLMQYPDYQRQGWPIGSGMVESANKVVVQARLKGAGMHWAPVHVNPMLALRTAVSNERWDEAWRDTVHEHRAQLSTHRRQMATTRFQSLISSVGFLLLQFRPLTPKPALQPSVPLVPAATLPGSSRPSAHHPWKRTPACRPKLVAKN